MQIILTGLSLTRDHFLFGLIGAIIALLVVLVLNGKSPNTRQNFTLLIACIFIYVLVFVIRF
jgi:formate-dependent nitrite reductase membrane component NrfD